MKKQEKAIKEIVKKYGTTINLKSSPYLIAEIVRNYAHVFNPDAAFKRGVADDNPPGTPPVPHSLPGDPQDIYIEVAKISKSLQLLHKKLDKLSK